MTALYLHSFPGRVDMLKHVGDSMTCNSWDSVCHRIHTNGVILKHDQNMYVIRMNITCDIATEDMLENVRQVYAIEVQDDRKCMVVWHFAETYDTNDIVSYPIEFHVGKTITNVFENYTVDVTHSQIYDPNNRHQRDAFDAVTDAYKTAFKY